MTESATVAVVYGFAEGGFHSRKLRTALLTAGFTLTSEIAEADIIIAHSAGCYLVPVGHQARVVLNIGYTYWPGRSLLHSLSGKLAEEYRRTGMLTWLKECAIHDIYALNIPYVLRLIKGWRAPEAYLQAMQFRAIFVRNQADPYCEPSAIMQAAGEKHTYLSLPGYHDHLWDEPKEYINLLKSVI